MRQSHARLSSSRRSRDSRCSRASVSGAGLGRERRTPVSQRSSACWCDNFAQRRRRDRRRSARLRPSVWQVGQYWKDLSAKETSFTVSPHTGHGRPARL